MDAKPLSLPPVRDARDVRRSVLALDRRLERFDRAILEAEWDLYAGRSRAGPDRWQLERSHLLGDPSLLGWIRRALSRSADPTDRRRLELLQRIVLDSAVEQHPRVVALRGRLQRTIALYRPRWNGKRVSRAFVAEVLRSSPRRSERRRAFYASEPLYRPLEPELRELVNLRNEGARAAGFRTFAEMRLGFMGLSTARLTAMVDDLTPALGRRIRALRDRWEIGRGRPGWLPWDSSIARAGSASLPPRSFPRAEMMPRILSAIGRWGFPVGRMRFRVVFHDVPSGGMTLAPDPPRDVRILVPRRGGWLAYMVMFHEAGHAVQSATVRAPGHLLRWHENIPGFGAYHEGVGGLFEAIPSERAWLAEQPGLSGRAVDRFVEAARAGEGADAAWHASWFGIELELYRRPDRDPMAVALRRERRLFGYDDYPPLSFVDHFFVDLPIYAPNYLLSILFTHQLREALREACGEPLWPNPRVGPWLTRHWFAPGSMIDGLEQLRAVTGRSIGPEAYLRALAG
jgi:hypothetical protein